MENIQVVVKQKAGSIHFNFEEMKGFLTNRLEEYKEAVFTDDSVNDAKKCVASLRKEQQAFKGRITEIKREYMSPFDAFKEKADQLVTLYDEPINLIDSQVKVYMARRKAEKKEIIKEVYDKTSVGITDYIPFEKIYNDKWENTSFKMATIKKEIEELAKTVKESIATIISMNSDASVKALEIYKKDLSLANAISYINQYEVQKREILQKEQEQQKQQELERIRKEERQKVLVERQAIKNEEEAERRAAEEKAAAVETARMEAAKEVIEELTPEFVGDTKCYEYRINLTEDAKRALEMYLDSIGIDYEVGVIEAWK